MKVEINRDKYINKIDVYHTIDDSGDFNEITEKDEKEIEERNKIKLVCLECTKEKCTGNQKCFNEERKKRNGKG